MCPACQRAPASSKLLCSYNPTFNLLLAFATARQWTIEGNSEAVLHLS